jgi:glycosyltransferase involved in cell wall biosynthesis
LKVTLESIIDQDEFDESIEVVVSDNASTDNTAEIIKSFCPRYANIKYYRNEKNIKDANFPIVLSYAHGYYVKLLSDNKPLNPCFLHNLKEALNAKPAIVFHLNKANVPIRYYYTRNIDKFIQTASFYSTWLPAYTFRKDLLDAVDIFNINTAGQLFQTELAMKILSMDPRCTFIIGDSFHSLEPMKKGGYNIFKVFIDNYLVLLKGTPGISLAYYLLEKKKLLLGFILPWKISISRQPEKYYFKSSGLPELILKYYKFDIISLFLFSCTLCYCWLADRVEWFRGNITY